MQQSGKSASSPVFVRPRYAASVERLTYDLLATSPFAVWAQYSDKNLHCQRVQHAVMRVRISLFLDIFVSAIPWQCMQVSVAELADTEWQMLPRQARSISSDQVQMQRQQSLVSQPLPCGINLTVRICGDCSCWSPFCYSWS